MRRRLLSALAAVLCACGGSAPERPSTSTTSSASSTLPLPSPGPSTTIAPITNQDEARRFLQERGIDPEKLSNDIAEHMRQRFQSPPGK